MELCVRRIPQKLDAKLPFKAASALQCLHRRGFKNVNFGRTDVMPQEDKLVYSEYNRRMRVLYLHHPKRHNALNPVMTRMLSARLEAFERNDFTTCTILRSRNNAQTGPLFCPGWDLLALYPEVARGDWRETHTFMQDMFNIVYQTTKLRCLYIPFMSGYACGTGAGLVMHAPLSVASDESILSFPEVRYGCTLDSGVTFALSRLDGELGMYLALTGQELKGIDLCRAGILNHYIGNHAFDAFTRQVEFIDEGSFGVRDLLQHAYALSLVAYELPKWDLEPHLDAIDRCFCFDSFAEIVDAVKREDSEWGRKTLKQLELAAPLAAQLTIRMLREAVNKDLAECMHTEFNVQQHLLHNAVWRERVKSYLFRGKSAPYFPPQAPTVDADKIYHTHDNIDELVFGYQRLRVNVGYGGLLREKLPTNAWEHTLDSPELSSSSLDPFFAPPTVDGAPAPLRLFRRDGPDPGYQGYTVVQRFGYNTTDDLTRPGFSGSQ